MPVDLSIANSINAAYAQGRAEAFARQQQADKLAQQAKEEEDKAALRDQAQKQFDAKQKQDAAQFDAEHKLHEAIFGLQQATAQQDQAQKGSEFTEKTGNPAQGYEPDLANSPTDTVESTTSPGTFVPRATKYVNKATGTSYTARSPEVTAQMSGQLAALAKEPLIKQDRDTALFESSLAEHRQKLHDTGQWNHESDIKAVEEAHQDARNEADHRNAIDVENLRGKYAMAVQNLKPSGGGGEQVWLDDKMDPQAAEAFKVPYGSTWHDVLGNVKLTADGQKKFLTLSTMEPEAIDAQELLDAKDSTGKTGYQRYFLGSVKGRFQEAYQNLYPDPEIEKIRPILSQLFLDAKDNAGVGSRLTAAQVQALKGITPGNERYITAERGKEIIEAILPAIRAERVSIIKAEGTKLKPSSTGESTRTSVSVPKSAGAEGAAELWSIVKPKAGK